MRKNSKNLSKIKTKKSENSKLFNSNFVSNSLKSNDTKKSISKSLNLKENKLSFYLNRIDDYTGFFTTQQLNNVDFSKFENHVFFDSAVDKVNYSFRKILNEFPYDSNEFLFDQYINSLDGYTGYLLNKVIPKNLGYIKFDSTNKVEIKDQSGYLFKNPVSTSNNKSTGYLDPRTEDFTFDFWLKPTGNSNNQIVFQKKLNETGYSVYLNNYEANTEKITINILYKNGTGTLKSFCEINHNQWNHININISKKRSKRTFTFHINGEIQKDNTEGQIFSEASSFEYKQSSLFIGHGEVHDEVSSVTSLSALMDNLRIFKIKLRKKDILDFKDKDINSVPELVLSLPFNEPPGNYINNDVVLDHSGKKLDGTIKSINGAKITKENISILGYKVKKEFNDLHIKYEKENKHPVRFPSFDKNISLQKELLEKAIRYDKINPNIFYKLFPKNLFVMSSEFENKKEIFVDNSMYIENKNSTKIITADSSSIVKIMAIWSRFFDQLKMYVDAFEEMLNLDYDSINKKDVLGMFLPTVVKSMGFEFKELLPASLKDKLDNKHLTHEEVYSDISIRHIQNELWKRFLINSRDFIKSKGTKKSINSAFNSMGIDSNRFVTIREFNGKNILNTKTNFTDYLQKYNYINFGNKKNLTQINSNVYLNNSRYPSNKFLLEIGNFDNTSNIFDDDWSIEFFVKYNSNLNNIIKNQSLLRIERSTNNNGNIKNRPLVNVKYSNCKKLIDIEIAEGKTDDANNSLYKKNIYIEDIDLCSGSNYYFCVQRKINSNDLSMLYKVNLYESNYPYTNTKSIVREEKFKFNNDRVIDKEVTSNISSVVVGPSNPDLIFHNENFPKIITSFEGKIHSLKLWKSFLLESEIDSHKIDQRNFGTKNPNNIFEEDKFIVNLDLRETFKKKDSEDYEISIDSKEFVLKNSSQFFNYILNQDDYGSVPADQRVVVFQDLENSINREIRKNIFCEAKIISNSNLSSIYENVEEIISCESVVVKKNNIKIDEPVIFNGVNINHFEDKSYNNIFGIKNKERKFNTDSNFEIDNDVRCSIDFSNVNFLNKEISNLISYNDFLNNCLNKSFSRYDYEYKDISFIREKLFNMFEKEIDFNPLYQIYKYFDNIMTDLLFQTIPSRVNYLGFNFVYESHALERHKYVYKMKENILPVVDNPLNSTSNKNIILVDNSKNTVKYRNQKKLESISTHVFQR